MTKVIEEAQCLSSRLPKTLLYIYIYIYIYIFNNSLIHHIDYIDITTFYRQLSISIRYAITNTHNVARRALTDELLLLRNSCSLMNAGLRNKDYVIRRNSKSLVLLGSVLKHTVVSIV